MPPRRKVQTRHISIPVPPDIRNPNLQLPPPPSHLPPQPSNSSNEDTSSQTPSPSPEPPACEFTTPCTTHLDPQSKSTPKPNNRKLISHIFGRNKLSTRLFPPSVWVHYCRKHYQRARYRAPNWAVAQVDLVCVSLQRMREWGGVRGFEVVLRRRALTPSLGLGLGLEKGKGEEMGKGKGKGRDSGSGSGSGRGLRNRRKGLRSSRGKNRDAGSCVDVDVGKGRSKRKSPTQVRGLVPSWLHQHLGPNKSFAEVRAMLELLRTYLKKEEGQLRAKKELRFPDIEILPVFEEWVGAVDRNGP